jgi:hypothetical protein
MKANETREETLKRLARDSYKGAKANKRFTSLVRRVLKTTKSEVDARAKAWKEARNAPSNEG